ncbi:MAG: DUF6588 family protein [Fulvivirga sp.]|nr:DUF6588 family protein [Fulvivirga sp.]
MRTTLLKRFFGLIFCASIIICYSNRAIAQGGIEKFVESGVENANNLIGGYVSPFMEGFGTGLGSGWTNTAKTHQTLGFDLQVTVSAAYIPDDDLFYTPAASAELSYAPNSPQPSPTVFGPDGQENQPVYEYTVTEEINGQTVTFSDTFSGPEGLGLKENLNMQAVPVPMAQIGIGIVKNTDLKVRYAPPVSFDNDQGELKLIGFAVMHDIKQHIPGIKLAPIDLSVLVGFTDFSVEYSLVEATTNATSGQISTADGRAVYDINNWIVQGLVSKKFSILTLYGGIGYNFIKSEFGLKGTYTVEDSDTNGELFTRDFVDPINITNNSSGPRVTAGMRLKLAIVTLHADYTVQKYNTLTVGFGFAVR